MIEVNLLLVFGVDQQLGDRHAEHRVNHLRSDLAERHQDELTTSHFWMRNAQVFFLYHLGAVEQNIQIDDASAPALLDLLSTHSSFDVFEFREQYIGLEFGLDFNCAVDVPVFGIAQGFAFVERRLFEDSGIRQFGKARQRLKKIVSPVADIRADADINLMSDRVCHYPVSGGLSLGSNMLKLYLPDPLRDLL